MASYAQALMGGARTPKKPRGKRMAKRGVPLPPPMQHCRHCGGPVMNGKCAKCGYPVGQGQPPMPGPPPM